MTKPSYSLVGIKACGCVTSAIREELASKDELDKFCEDMERNLIHVERKDDEWVRANFGHCLVHKVARQMGLF